MRPPQIGLDMCYNWSLCHTKDHLNKRVSQACPLLLQLWENWRIGKNKQTYRDVRQKDCNYMYERWQATERKMPDESKL